MKNPRASPNTCGSIRTTPAIGVWVNFMLPAASILRIFVDYALQVLTVTALLQRLGQCHQLVGADEARAPGNLLDAGHFQSLPLLDDAHEHARIEQSIVCPGIEP